MKDGSSIRILFTVSNVAFILATICLLITIILFIRFRIPSVIDDLSGRTARRSIEKIQEKNEKSRTSVNRELQPVSPETVLLPDPYETEALEETAELLPETDIPVKPEMIEEIILIHTEEKLLS